MYIYIYIYIIIILTNERLSVYFLQIYSNRRNLSAFRFKYSAISSNKFELNVTPSLTISVAEI